MTDTPKFPGPPGYLVKDFADGWFWSPTPDTQGAACWDIQKGEWATNAQLQTYAKAAEEWRCPSCGAAADETHDGCETCAPGVWTVKTASGEELAMSPVFTGTPVLSGTPRAVLDVLRERTRQMTEEGFTLPHDTLHNHRWELSRAAASYAMAPGASDGYAGDPTNEWPWSPNWYKHDHDNPRRSLVKAAALILAEIERLDRQ